MKNRLLKNLFCLTPLLWPLVLSGQIRLSASVSNLTEGGKMAFPPPEAWRFALYGNDRPDLYTGAMKTSIPVYVYKDKDFELPITLDYATSGCKPNEQAGSVGVGWYLNAGGCINREVNGIPDETLNLHMRKESYGFSKVFGLYHVNAPLPTFSQLAMNLIAMQDNRVHFPYTFYSGEDERIETFPDTFSFGFGDYHGKFCFDYEGVRVFASNRPPGDFMIDAHLGMTDNPEDSVYFYGFTIYTGDGYTYIFGCDENLRQHSRKCFPQFVVDYGIKSSAKLSWPLTKIIAPGGRYVKFNYSESMVCDVGRPSVASYPSPGFSTDDSISGSYFMDLTAQSFVLDDTPYYLSTISSIDIDGKTLVDFLYTDSPREKYNSNGTNGILEMRTIPQLDKIIVKDISDPAKTVVKRTVKLSYSYALQNPQRFLVKVAEEGMGEYTMQYNGIATTKMPYHGNTGLDIWGYYSGKDCYDLSFYGGGYAYQASTLSGTALGTLKSIAYPTGGRTEIEYEKNDYAHAYAHHDQVLGDEYNKMYPFTVPCVRRETGGVRVRKITDFDACGKKYEREYVYQSDGRSTGLQIYPKRLLVRTGIYSTSALNAQVEQYIPIVSPPTLNTCFFDKTHIEYSSVTEKHPDGSSTVYHFSNMLDTPDISEVNPYGYKHMYGSEYSTTDYHRAASSMAFQRGKLTRTDYLDADGNKVRSVVNHYDKSVDLDYIAAYNISDKEFYAIRYFTDDYPLDYVADCRYFGQDSIETVTRYTYNSTGQLKTSTVTASDGKLYETAYRYPADMPDDPMCLKMSLYNAQALPVWVQESLIRPNGDTLLLRGVRNEYTLLPKAGMKLLLSKATHLAEPVACKDFDFENLLENRVRYAYTALGNILSVSDRSVDTVLYIWGYGGMYPVAEVRGASLSDILAVEGLDNIETRPLTKGLNRSQVKALQSLSGAMVTVYDYTVPFGLSSVTDPSGRVVYYNYDTYGRLDMVQDDKGQPVEEYKYNIHR